MVMGVTETIGWKKGDLEVLVGAEGNGRESPDREHGAVDVASDPPADRESGPDLPQLWVTKEGLDQVSWFVSFLSVWKVGKVGLNHL